jgi:hypothetical protein
VFFRSHRDHSRAAAPQLHTECYERKRRLAGTLAKRGSRRDTVSVLLPNALALECHYGVPMTGALFVESSPTRGAALLGVVVHEDCTLLADAVDVGVSPTIRPR